MRPFSNRKLGITVIIPSYEPKGYLLDCLRSLRAQTLDRGLFEVFLVLNGCGDQCVHECKNLVAVELQGINARLFVSNMKGVSIARNIGIDEAGFEFICFIDDDDWVSENYLEGLLAAHSGDNAIAVANVLAIEDSTNIVRADYLSAAFLSYRDEGQVGLLRGRSFFSTACAKLIPAAAVGVRRFKVGVERGEDALFMAEISDRVNIVDLASPDVVYYRRVRVGSASRVDMRFATRLREALRLFGGFVRLFSQDPRGYNMGFFLSRLLAVIISFVRRY